MGQITISDSLTNFFHEEILKSMFKLKLKCDNQALYYVGGMLSDFNYVSSNEPLAIRMAHALEMTEIKDGANELKKIGDCCLFISGFANGSLNKYMKDKNYCFDLGRNAYSYAVKGYNLLGKNNLVDSLTKVIYDFDPLTKIIEDVFLNNQYSNESKENLIKKLKHFF